MLRKTMLSLVTMATLSLTSMSFAAEGDAGLGLIVGEPTGLSGKYWLSESTALDGAMAWSRFDNREAFQLQLDYVMHDFGLFSVDRGSLPLYYGVGGKMSFNDNGRDRLGVRVPVGLAYIFPSQRADVFLELVPTLDVTPSTDFNLEGGAGVRYFFR